MNQLEAMRTFLRVAEFRSFSRAAEADETSRAVVSAQVQALERHLGVTLLTRTTRRVTLTDDGAAYLARARRILDELQAADDDMRRVRETAEGRLRVDMPAMFGRYLLLPELPAFAARYPKLALDIQYNDRVVDLGAERVDVAVRFVARRDPRHIARRIGTTRLVTCAAPDYLRRSAPIPDIDSLRGHRLIGQTRAGGGSARDWAFRAGTQIRRLGLPTQVSFNGIEGALQAALAGLGVIQTVDLVVQDLVARGRLAIVLPDTALDGPPVSVVYQKVHRTAAKVRVFVEFVAELFERWNRQQAMASAAGSAPRHTP